MRRGQAYEAAVEMLLEALADRANADLRAPSGARYGAALSRRTRAAEALGDLSDTRALDGLITVLDDADESLAAAAATALGKLEHRDAVAPLGAALARDRGFSIRHAACEALLRLGEDGEQVLAESLMNDDWELSAAAANGLQMASDLTDPDRLLHDALSDQRVHVREHALYALARRRGVDSRLPALLRTALADPVPSVRVAAAYAIATRRVVPDALIDALGDEDGKVRARAASGLGAVSDRLALPALAATLEDEDEGVRARAARAIGQIHGRGFLSGFENGGYRIGALIQWDFYAPRLYEALNTVDGSRVAMKLVPYEWLGHRTALAEVRRELAAAAALQHPNVVPAHGTTQIDAVPVLVMPYLDLTPLSDLLPAQAPSRPRAGSIVAGAARGLAAIHASGRRHGDVKPDNVLFDGSGRGYITAVGVASRLPPRPQAERVDRDLHVYWAPEVITGEAPDARSDLYSIGCVLFEALTGSEPYPRERLVPRLSAHLYDPVPSAKAIVADMPDHVDTALKRAMAKDPADRYPSVVEFARGAGLWDR